MPRKNEGRKERKEKDGGTKEEGKKVMKMKEGVNEVK